MFVEKVHRPVAPVPPLKRDLETRSGMRMPQQITPAPAGAVAGKEAVSVEELKFNIGRLVIAATLLVIILVFAIGTAFYNELSQIHTMLVHAFELILGLIAGLLGGEVIANSSKS